MKYFIAGLVLVIVFVGLLIYNDATATMEAAYEAEYIGIVNNHTNARSEYRAAVRSANGVLVLPVDANLFPTLKAGDRVWVVQKVTKWWGRHHSFKIGWKVKSKED